MAGIIYDLVDVLEKQKECYEGLLTLATYKAEAVTQKELEFLTQVVEREEEFIGRGNLLDKKREGIIKDIAIVTSMDYKTMTVTKLVEKLGSEIDVTEKLLELRADILNLIDQLKRQNELNSTLLRQSLEFVDFTVNAIQSTQIIAPNANYSRPGEKKSLETKSFFDTKQ